LVSTKKTYIDPSEFPELDGSILARIIASLRPYRGLAALVVACVASAAGLGVLPPLLVKDVVDHAIPAGDLGRLLLLCAGMLAVPLATGLIGVLRKRMTTLLGERVVRDFRQQVFEHLQRQSLGYLAAAPPGSVLSSVLNDVKGTGSAVSTLVGAINDSLVFASTAVLVLVLDWRLGLVSLSLLPLFVAPTRSVGRQRKRLRREGQARMAEITGILAETLSVSGAHLVKIFNAERYEAERLRRKSNEYLEVSLREAVLGRWFQMLTGLFETAGPALIFGLGGYLVIRDGLALGTVVAFVTVLKRLYGPASGLAQVHVDLVTSYAYFERLFRVLDREPDVADAPGVVRPASVDGRITFRRVFLEYDDGTLALRDIDLEIAPGQCVGVVGPSGAGKTSLVGMVARQIDPTKGGVLLDGRDLRDIELSALRSHIGVVTQDTYLFHASVLENLKYARPEAASEKIEEAARAAQIHDFIAALPDGYHTIVGERGYRLSGGQRQRLALARAILKDARILLLDEPTNSLDSASEALVQRALGPLLAGRTSLWVTHRLSAVREADLIVVLDEGRIRERGTHPDLLERGGLYAQLYRDQARRPMAASSPERADLRTA
jgi:ATP-binding cassette subfamily B protein